MHILISILLLTAHHSAQAEIFKQTGPDGVIFTDQPDQSQPAIELRAQDLPALNQAQVPSIKPAQHARKQQPRPQSIYSQLAIIKPSHDDMVRDNAGNVEIKIAITPALHTVHGHQLVLYLDDIRVAHGSTPTLQLTNIDRGTHTLRAQIETVQGGLVQAAPIVHFHLQRYRLGQ